MKKLLITSLITVLTTIAVQAQTLTSAQVQADVIKVLQEKYYNGLVGYDVEVKIVNLPFSELMVPDGKIYYEVVSPKDRYLPRIDCGRYEYNIRLFEGGMYEVNKLAEEFNSLPYAINVFPTGGKEKTYSRLKITGNVVIPTVKPTGNGYVMRVYNPCDEAQAFKIEIGGKSLQDTVKKRSVISVVYTENGFCLKERMDD